MHIAVRLTYLLSAVSIKDSELERRYVINVGVSSSGARGIVSYCKVNFATWAQWDSSNDFIH